MTTVYNVTNFDFSYWGFLAFPVIFGLVATLVFNAAWGVGKLTKAQSSIATKISLGLTATVTIAIGYALHQKLKVAVDALENQTYQTTTGRLEVIRHQASNIDEIVNIGRKRFTYNSHLIEPGYRTPIKDSDVLKEGKKVRVFYIGNYILRIDLYEEQLNVE